MKKIMFMLMVMMLTMSINAQNNVDSRYFMGDTLTDGWQYGAVPAAQAAYHNHFGGMTMIIYPDSLMLDGHMYAIAFSKSHSKRKMTLLIDWTGKNEDFAELTIVHKKIPLVWTSGELCLPIISGKATPEPIYYELYPVDLHWIGYN